MVKAVNFKSDGPGFDFSSRQFFSLVTLNKNFLGRKRSTWLPRHTVGKSLESGYFRDWIIVKFYPIAHKDVHERHLLMSF